MLVKFITEIDLIILDFIQQHMHSPLLDKIMVFFTQIGYAGIIWLLIAITLILFKQHRKNGIFLLLAILTITIIGEFGLKNLIGRIRPCYAYPIDKMLINLPPSFSCPSGHTGSSFASAIFLIKHYKKTGIPLMIMAIIISFSRLYLYVHYPTDILFGVILGSLIGLVWYKISQKNFLNLQNKKN